jgi:hypothetical protein
MPTAVGTAVIAEKGDGKKVGGQAAVLLPTSLTPNQGRLMNKAYEIAKAHGHKNPELVQSVLLQESDAGAAPKMRVANPGPEAYFGPMQLKLVAAKAVLSRWPDLFTKYHFQTRTDDEIKANLILNDVFNIEVGSKYLLILQREYGFTGRELLNAYNRGPSGVKAVGDDYHYAVGAEKKLAAYKRKI